MNLFILLSTLNADSAAEDYNYMLRANTEEALPERTLTDSYSCQLTHYSFLSYEGPADNFICKLNVSCKMLMIHDSLREVQ